MTELSTIQLIGITIMLVVIAYIALVPWLSLTHLRGIEEELSRIRKALEEKEENVSELVRCGGCIHLTDHDCPISWHKNANDYCSFGEK